MKRASEDRRKGNGAARTQKLRDKIDRGGTGDKVAFLDPAAVPLGTDAEAAGHPPSKEEVRMAERLETVRADAEPKKQTPGERQRPPIGTGISVALTVAGLIIVAILFVAFS